MNFYHTFPASARLLAPIFLTSALAACSDSDLSSNSISDRIVTRGTVTALDSVSVNGRYISVSNASIYLDDQMADRSALRTGMKVILYRQNDVATDIHYAEDVKGPVDAIDTTGNIFVMGQSVIISSSTLFDDSSNGSINAGDIVEVSGLRDSDGKLHATYIEKKQSLPNAFKVQGPIAQLNTTDQTFVIGDLLIEYADSRFDDIPGSSLRDGIFVEVKDESRLYEPGSLYLRASKIERYRDVLTVSDSSSTNSSTQHTEVEIEAFVTSIVSDNVFQLGSLPVRILPTTRFRDGERQQLQVNVRIEVEGWLNTDGELEAWEIEFEDGSDYFDSDDDDYNTSSGGSDDDDDTEDELEGVVSAMNADEGLVVINGIEVRVDTRTEFENRHDQNITRIQFFDLITIGNTVVKVEWKNFNSYTDAPHEVEIEI